MTRVLLLGLDGAEPTLIENWLHDLPNLRRLMQGGVSGTLESSIPPLSIPAWSCIGSGKNPGKIGVFSFLHREASSYDVHVVNSTVIKSPYLWNILSEKGKRVVVLNVPGTFPPEKVNGVLVSGMPAPSNDGRLVYTYPSALSRELDTLVGGYEVDYPWIKLDRLFETRATFGSVFTYDRFVEIVSETLEKQLRIAENLLDKERWDFAFIVFTALDRICHLAWRFMDRNHPNYDDREAKRFGDTIHRFYVKIDSLVGRLLSHTGNDTVTIVVSDHGFGPLYEKFYLNEWLRRLGFLSLAGRRRLQVSILANSPISRERISKLLIRHNLSTLLNMTPKSIRKMFRGAEFEDISGSIDWPHTRAYSYGAFGFIFLNVKGREPKGIVRRGEDYDRLQREIIAALKRIRDPKGNLLVDQIWKADEIYHGPYADLAPDLLLRMDHFRCRVSSGLGRRNLFDPDPLTSGTHRPTGIFIAHGEGIRLNSKIRAHVHDIAPTILHSMGISVPQDMDGRPLIAIFDPSSSFAKRQVAYEGTGAIQKAGFKWTEEDEERIKTQLKRLGYVE
jgi:predicted AlkP superfamily phosphohydrolase/phosphomutase